MDKRRKKETVETRAVGGMASDEDDSLEYQHVMSSPIKGADYRQQTQVCKE